MSKTRRWVIILLSLAVLVMIGINLADKDDTAQVVVNNNEPTYKSEHTDTVVYSPEGALSYHLIAQHVEYYSDQAVSWFTQPVLTTFDKDKVPTWSIKADKAKLTNDRMLYLYGHVEVNALVPDSQLRRITTDNAQINLVTQDVTSDDLVTLYGTTFNSSGLKMRGNLRSKNAELIEKVRTSYDGKEVIDGYGNPATFYQMQDNGKPVKGRASQMHYELAKDFVVLTGKAYLEQLDSNITGDKITYLVKEQKMQAFSEKGKRVTTVLVPSQLQDKNKTKAPAEKKGN